MEDDLQKIIDPFGRETVYSYYTSGPDVGRLESVTDFIGRTTTYEYDAGRLWKVIEPAVLGEDGATAFAPTTVYTYDTATDLLATVTDPLGRKTQYNYGHGGRLIERLELAPNGTVLRQYSYSGMMATSLLAINPTTNSPTAPAPAVSNNSTNPNYLFQAHEVNERGYAVKLTTDKFGQISSLKDPLGNQVIWERDGATGLILSRTETIGVSTPVIATTSYEYAEYPYLTSVTHHDSEERKFQTYNNVGRPTRLIDELGRIVDLVYDDSGNGPNVISRTYVVGSVGGGDDITYLYEYTDGGTSLPKGLLELVTDPNDQATTYEYFDEPEDVVRFGRVERIIYADQTFVEFDYGVSSVLVGSHNVITLTESMTDELGRVTTWYYDALGRLIRIEHPEINSVVPVTQYRYDLLGNLRFVIDAEANRTEHQYDLLGQKIATLQSDPETGTITENSPTIQYTFDPAGNPRAEIDPIGRITSYQHDPANRMFAQVVGRQIGQSFPTGTSAWTNPVYRYDVNGDGRVDARDQAAILDFLGCETSINVPGVPPETLPFFTVDINGDSETNAADKPFYYDVNGDGVINNSDYVLVGEAFSQSPPFAGFDSVTFFSYDPAGNLVAIIDPNGNRTDIGYDSRGRRTSIVQDFVPDPANSNVLDRPVTTYTFDAASQLIQSMDPLGNATDYLYDDLGRLTAIVQPDFDGFIWTWQNSLNPFDVNSDGVVNEDDETALESELAFPIYHSGSGSGGPFLAPHGPTQPYFDVNDDNYIDGDDLAALVAFRANGTVDPKISNGRSATRFVYDDASNLRFVIDAMQSVTEFQYDERNRRIYRIDQHPTGPKTIPPLSPPRDPLTLVAEQPVYFFDLDDAGRLREIHDYTVGDETYRVIEYVLDPLDRLTSLVLPDADGTPGGGDQPVFLFGYDLVGNLTSSKDAENNETTYVLDKLYRLTERHQPEVDDGTGTPAVPITYFYYDDAGQLERIVDPLERETEYVYDSRGNIFRIIAFEFDLSGFLLQASDPAFTYDYVPDQLGRVTSATLALEAISVDVELVHEYDRMNNRTSLSAVVDGTSDFITTSQYDVLNRWISVTQDAIGSGGNAVAEKRVDWKYDLASQMKSATRYAGLTTSDPLVSMTLFVFDKTGRVEDIEHRNGDSPTNPLAKYTYSWDQANRLLTFDSLLDGLANYGYDDAGQLTSAAYSDYLPFQLDEDYEYDDNGNRVDAGYTNHDIWEVTAYWDANAGAGTTVADSSPNEIDLEMVGDVDWSDASLPPVANNEHVLTFDGSADYLKADNTGNAALKIGSGDFSIAAWIKLDTGTTQRMAIAAHGNPFDTGGTGFELSYLGGTTTRALVAYFNNGSGAPQQVVYNTHGLLQNGNWRHVALTIDRDGAIRLFMDGVVVKAAAASKAGNIQPATDFWIGRSHTCAIIGEGDPVCTNTGWFKGLLDDVKVYHAALSPADVSNLYRGQYGNHSVSYFIDTNNQLTGSSDGYSYQYDEEGNRTVRSYAVGLEWENYSWDHRNRLTSVQKSGTREAAMYDFESDEGGQAVDILGHALAGQFFGNVALTKAQNDGQEDSEYALEFDGDGDYVTVGIQDLFAVPSTGFTLMAWIKPQATSSLMGIASFGTMPGMTNSGYRFYYVGTSSAEKVIFQINDGSGTPLSITYNISGSIQDEWHHVAVTIDAFSQSTPQIRLFFDGSQVEAATFTKTGAWGVADQPFTIGAITGGNGGHFTGLIDDVRVVHGAFSQGHIAYAMTTAVPTLYLLSTVEYTYDHQNRLLSRYAEVNAPFGSPTETVEYYVHDGAGQSTTSARLAPDNLEQVGQIVLRLDEEGNVLNRYLWGPGVDQLVADEQVTDPQEPGEVLWALTDHLGTVRDLVRYDSGEDEVVPVVHRAYDAFGNITEDVRTEAVDVLFGFTGRPFDEVTGLQNNLNRWYDAAGGRWVSEDPVGFLGADVNLLRYVGNRIAQRNDASGLFGGPDSQFDRFNDAIRSRRPIPEPDNGRSWHYDRNDKNNPPPTEEEAINEGWIKLPPDKSIYHMHGDNGSGNSKYTSPDGHQEGVYDSGGNLVTSPENQGTYNYYPPDDWRHVPVDVFPYWIWRNSPDDPTPIWDRIFGPPKPPEPSRPPEPLPPRPWYPLKCDHHQ